MLERLLDKIGINNKCNLSVEELRILYEIDHSLDINLDFVRSCRNNYEDFCKIFGKKFVARTSSDIDENTICYVGDLIVDRKIPTYNLKYIYGMLDYRLSQVYNLENLEKVYAQVFGFKEDDMVNLEGRFIKNFLIDLEKMDVDTVNDIMEINKYINSVAIYCKHSEMLKYINLPDKLYQLKLFYLDSIEGLVFPKSLKQLYLSSDNLNIITFEDSLMNVYLPDDLAYLYLDGPINIKNLRLPDSLKMLVLTHRDNLAGGVNIKDDLLVYYYYSSLFGYEKMNKEDIESAKERILHR